MRNAAQVAQKSGTLRMMLPSGLIFTLLAGGISLLLGLALGKLSVTYSALIASLFLLLIIFLLKLDELTVVLIVAVHIFVDSYLAFDIYQVALLLTLTFLAIRYFGRSTKRPWSGPRAVGLWIVFLVLNIYPTLEGGDFSLSNSFSFYLNIVLSAFLLFWLGNMVARDVSALRRVFQFLAILATLIAIHTLIEAITGTFLFQIAQPQYATDVSASFQIPGANISRAGSFFGNPNGNAVFLATTFAFPLGLCIECKRPLLKLLYLLETLLILMALLFTYSTGAWLAVMIGWLVFMFLVGTKRRWISVLVLTLIVGAVVSLAFSAQITALLSHASDNSDFSLHTADWQTTLRVIAAYPLFGVGLGNQAYLIRAEPYRVPAQYIPLAEPDNSFLQWGATSGIPALLVFILLLGTTIWFAWRNWQAIDIRYRPLVASGIAALMVLSVNSLSADGWTDAAAMGYLGWLVAGLVSSASIRRGQYSTVIPDVSSASVELIATHKMGGVRNQPGSHAAEIAESSEVQEVAAIQAHFAADLVESLENRKIDSVQTKTFSVNRAWQDAEHE